MAPHLKPPTFNYQDHLCRLQALMGRCMFQPSHPTDYEDIQGFVIMLEEFLRTNGYPEVKYRRQIRLAMLSIATNKKVGTTYDLMANEVQTFRYFVTSRETGEITRLGEIFLSELATDAQDRVVSLQRSSSKRARNVSNKANVPDMS